MLRLDPSFVASYALQTPPWGFNGLGEVIYLRTYSRPVSEALREYLPDPEWLDLDPEKRRNEKWHETIARCINGAQSIGADYSKDEMEILFDHIFNLRASFSGRGLWQLGTPLVDRLGGPSLINCFFTLLERIEDFEFLMDMLMVGGGVGFSVERSSIHELPKVKSGVKIVHEASNDADIIVPDKREGWSRLLHSVLKSYLYTGKSFSYSTILIRGFGAPLRTFGGTASGPQALIEGIEDICRILESRAGKKLRSLDVLDIANIIGRIVVAGSSRRSAEISLGDPDDYLFLGAKDWSTGTIPGWRQNSNNSIILDDWAHVVPRVWRGYEGNGEPYGFINRDLMRRVGRLGEHKSQPEVMGVNPCAEIPLEDGECCNLATIFLPNVESYEQFVEISRLLYKTQKAITTLWFPYEKTRAAVAKNARLGQNPTGVLQATEEQLSWLDPGYRELVEFDKQYSKERGLNPSVAVSTMQPGGTLPLLAGVTAGMSPAEGRNFIRRVRFGSNDPLVAALRDRGHRVQYDVDIDGSVNHTRFVVDFPCESPKSAVLAEELSAVDHLEWQKRIQTIWADNAVSITVRYRPEELPAIKAWLAENYNDSVKSVSFLLLEDHNFALAPLEKISEWEYSDMVEKLDLSIPLPGGGDMLALDGCVGGACPIR